MGKCLPDDEAALLGGDVMCEHFALSFHPSLDSLGTSGCFSFCLFLLKLKKIFNAIKRTHIFFSLKMNLRITHSHYLESEKVQTTAKYPLPPKGGRLCEENFLRYLDLYYVNSTCNKLKTFPLS